MRLMMLLVLGAGLTACSPTPTPTKAVPCVVLEPRTTALRAGLRDHPETPDVIGIPAAQIILGTERVCK